MQKIKQHTRLFGQKPVTVRSYFREPYKIHLNSTRWQRFVFAVKRFLYRCFLVTSGIALLYVAGFIGSYVTPRIVYAEPDFVLPPVLGRIAQCESHNSHYCTADLVALKMCPKGMLGQVLVRGNNNKSVDVGRYQLNADTWGAIATGEGLDIFKESDNEKMALWIYENRGTADWEASRKCWYK